MFKKYLEEKKQLNDSEKRKYFTSKVKSMCEETVSMAEIVRVVENASTRGKRPHIKKATGTKPSGSSTSDRNYRVSGDMLRKKSKEKEDKAKEKISKEKEKDGDTKNEK